MCHSFKEKQFGVQKPREVVRSGAQTHHSQCLGDVRALWRRGLLRGLAPPHLSMATPITVKVTSGDVAPEGSLPESLPQVQGQPHHPPSAGPSALSPITSSGIQADPGSHTPPCAGLSPQGRASGNARMGAPATEGQAGCSETLCASQRRPATCHVPRNHPRW